MCSVLKNLVFTVEEFVKPGVKIQKNMARLNDRCESFRHRPVNRSDALMFLLGEWVGPANNINGYFASSNESLVIGSMGSKWVQSHEEVVMISVVLVDFLFVLEPQLFKMFGVPVSCEVVKTPTQVVIPCAKLKVV